MNRESGRCGHIDHSGMRFAVLGPVSAWRHTEELGLGSPLQRALLSALLLRDGRTATAEALIDDLWGESAPEHALAALRTYASGLRKALGSASGLLVSTAGGYALRHRQARASLDADRVAALTVEAEQAESDGHLERARELYGMALAQWEGQPLSRIPGPFARTQRVRLEEWRLTLQERRLDLDVRVGRHAAVVVELTSVTVEHPWRERLRELLMLALYRSGRQADALAVYDDFRKLLARDLGIDPTPQLQRRHQQILANDPALQPAGARAAI